MWDELAAAVWLDPSLVKRSQKMLEDVAAGDGADYGSTLSWPIGRGPGLGEREVEVVQDVDVPRFERLTVKLLGASRAPMRVGGYSAASLSSRKPTSTASPDARSTRNSP